MLLNEQVAYHKQIFILSNKVVNKIEGHIFKRKEALLFGGKCYSQDVIYK